jgi:TIR domain
MDGVQHRIYRQALANRLAIAVGANVSSAVCSLPRVAAAIQQYFNLDLRFDDREIFTRWNDFVAEIEKAVSRAELTQFAAQYLTAAVPTDYHRLIATIPVSQFILTSFDRSFLTALTDAGRRPLLHDFDRQSIGSWRETDAATPSVFFMLPAPNPANPWWSLQNQVTKENIIHISNLNDMLAERDLLLLGYAPEEAEYVLQLRRLAMSGEKMINVVEGETDPSYWAARGVFAYSGSVPDIIRLLVPKDSAAEGRYGAMDQLIPRLTVADAFRHHFDVFISYYSGDSEFVRRLQRDLEARNVHVWRDEHEIEIGDSLSQKIQEGLQRSHSMAVVLSPDALARPWVNDELRAGYAKRLAGDFKIFPVLHKDCPLPPLLADYRYADFRTAERYEESLSLLERSIKNAVRRASMNTSANATPAG